MGRQRGITDDDSDLLRVHRAVEASGDIAYDWDLVSDAVTWSGALGALAQVIGDSKVTSGAEYLRHVFPEELLARRRVLMRHVREGEPFDCEYRIGDGAGVSIWVHERGSALLGDDGRPLRLVGTLRVVTARKQEEASLRYQLSHDHLTGQFNRARLGEELAAIISYNQQFDQKGVYFTVGIDRLSIINDAFGPQTGDAILQELAARLDMRPPIGDVVGRVGGDWFGIGVAQCREEDVEHLAERVLEEMRAHPVETPDGPIYVTASVGGVLLRETTESVPDLMAKSEVALREAKRSGRNCFVLYDHAERLSKGARESVAIAERVQDALRQNRLCFAYQPIVDAGTGRISHYEALLRMIDESGALVAAGAFMPVIEEMGLVRQVDRKVLEMAAADLRQNPEVTLAINVSGLTACDRGWLVRLRELTADTPDLPRRLVIELTETVALRDVEETGHFVDEVRSLGCRVALDDFGAGYSSFTNLRAFEVDVVKIDGSFVRNVASNRDNQLFIKSLVGLAQGFSLSTVAECVETAEDAALLADHGVDFMQGFFFGRPDAKRPWLDPAAIRAATYGERDWLAAE